MSLKELVLGVALATGLGACATTRFVCTIGGVTRYTVEDKEASLSFYTGGVAETPSGESMPIGLSSCAITAVYKERGDGFSLIDKDCDGTVDFFIKFNEQGERSYMARDLDNEEHFKNIDQNFKESKDLATGGKPDENLIQF